MAGLGLWASWRLEFRWERDPTGNALWRKDRKVNEEFHVF